MTAIGKAVMLPVLSSSVMEQQTEVALDLEHKLVDSFETEIVEGT